ncbi:hypothetical protein KCV03_g156, partial [Aureobasidium melanogenum]
MRELFLPSALLLAPSNHLSALLLSPESALLTLGLLLDGEPLEASRDGSLSRWPPGMRRAQVGFRSHEGECVWRGSLQLCAVIKYQYRWQDV